MKLLEKIKERRYRRNARECLVLGVIFGAFGGVSFMWVAGVPFGWIPAGAIMGTLAVVSVPLYYSLVWLSRWAEKKNELPEDVKRDVWEKLQNVLKLEGDEDDPR